jgi:cell division protein FtsL
MTPPATAAARSAARVAARAEAATRPARGQRRAPVRRTAVPRIARRVSGPARPHTRRAPKPAAPLAQRLVEAVRTLPDRRLVDRLLRGRIWIVAIGFLLIGIVAMQVSLLKLNASINRAVEQSSSLERTNGELRATVSRLSSGERIQEAAARLGMVMAPAGQVHYLRARRGRRQALRAAHALRDWKVQPPAPVTPTPAPAATPAQPTPAMPGTPVAGQPAGTPQTSPQATPQPVATPGQQAGAAPAAAPPGTPAPGA